MLAFQFFGFEIPMIAVVALVGLVLLVRVLKLAFGGRGGHAATPPASTRDPHDHMVHFHGKDIRVRKTVEWILLTVALMWFMAAKVEPLLVSWLDVHGLWFVAALIILASIWIQSLDTIKPGNDDDDAGDGEKDAPMVAIPTVLGRPLRGCKPIDLGLHSFLARGLYHGYITMRAGIIELHIDPIAFTTPDNVRLTLPVSIAFQVRDFYTAWRNGRIEGVKDKLTEMVEQFVREWGRSPDDGPRTWQEAQAAGNEAIAVIVEGILGTNLPVVNSIVPAYALYRYFNKMKPTTSQAEKWNTYDATGKMTGEWGELKKALPVNGELDTLIAQVKARFAEVEKVKSNAGVYYFGALGIDIVRVNIGEITLVDADVAKDSEKKAREELQRAAEKTEWEGVCDRVRDALGLPSGSPLAFGTPAVDGAFNRFQAERAKLTYIKVDAPAGTPVIVNPGTAAAAATKPPI